MRRGVDPQTCRVALLAGGDSGERSISLASGEGAGAALREAGFTVTELDPAAPAHRQRLLTDDFDVAFLCMHGKGGEDGTLQGFLETINLPYTGSGVWSSSTAMNKSKSKLFYEQAGIPVPPAFSVIAGQPYDVEAMAKTIQGRCVVKPATEGSALGVYIVEGPEALETAIQDVLKIDSRVVVEKYIQGLELTVAVVGNEDAEAYPAIEIIPKSEFYDFESKYAPNGSQHICPARIPEDLAAVVCDYAVRAHQALECRGMSRSDFILDEAGVPWILETNTIPGMTATSLLPDAAAAAGVSFPELCTKIIELAFEK